MVPHLCISAGRDSFPPTVRWAGNPCWFHLTADERRLTQIKRNCVRIGKKGNREKRKNLIYPLFPTFPFSLIYTFFNSCLFVQFVVPFFILCNLWLIFLCELCPLRRSFSEASGSITGKSVSQRIALQNLKLDKVTKRNYF